MNGKGKPLLEEIVDKDGNISYHYKKGRPKGYKNKVKKPPVTEEQREKWKQASTEKWKDNDYRRKVFRNNYDIRRNSYVITNGTENKLHLAGEPIPEGWRRGRVYHKSPEEIRQVFLFAHHFGHNHKKERKKENEFESKEDS